MALELVSDWLGLGIPVLDPPAPPNRLLKLKDANTTDKQKKLSD